MRDAFKFIGFCLLAAAIFMAEISMILKGILWLFPPESWWQVPLFIFLVIMGMAAGFFLLWMLASVFWEIRDASEKESNKKDPS